MTHFSQGDSHCFSLDQADLDVDVGSSQVGHFLDVDAAISFADDLELAEQTAGIEERESLTCAVDIIAPG